MESYLRTAVERARKIQEVILRAVANKITWTQAGEIIALCEREMRRWQERYEEFGCDRLFDCPGKAQSEARGAEDGGEDFAAGSLQVRILKELGYWVGKRSFCRSSADRLLRRES
jgi:hypothetical protein